MKISIIYDFREGPYGGGNQFLKALRLEFQRNGASTDKSEDADIFLFNGYPFADFSAVDRLHDIRQKYPEKAYVMRLDGPTFLVRGRHKYQDQFLKGICDTYMDGVIFQSDWCRRRNKQLTGIKAQYETVIHNAPDKTIFNTEGRVVFSNDRKIRIVAASWSSNIRKGFDVYRYLDENLDWSKYEMTFVGNSPFAFKHIRWVKPLPSADLAQLLKQHDIYLTASRNDPCSNSLLEAMNCGLPAVAVNDGGHPELIGEGGVLFREMDEVPEIIDIIIRSYDSFRRALPVHDIGAVAQMYLNFGNTVRRNTVEHRARDIGGSVVLFSRYRKLHWYFRFHDFLTKIGRRLHRGR